MRLIPTLTLAALILTASAAPALARHHHRDHPPTREEHERRNERNGLHTYYGGYGDTETVATSEHPAHPPRMHGPRDHGPLAPAGRDAKHFDKGGPVT